MDGELQVFVPPSTPRIGTEAGYIKPISEGTVMTVVQEADTKQASSGWAWLDDIGTTLGNGLSTALGLVVQREINDLTTGAESTVTSHGNPDDQPQGATVQTKGGDLPFYVKYKTELLIGGGVIVAAALIYAATRR